MSPSHNTPPSPPSLLAHAQACWVRHGARASAWIAVSPDGRRATKTKNGTSSCILETPRDDVTVRVVKAVTNFIYLGFIHPADFAADGDIFDKPGARMMYCCTGKLYGSGKKGDKYHNVELRRIVNGSTVRFVRDRGARTVSFTIDGHCPGVAFEKVPDGDLFVACQLFDQNDCVEIVA